MVVPITVIDLHSPTNSPAMSEQAMTSVLPLRRCALTGSAMAVSGTGHHHLPPTLPTMASAYGDKHGQHLAEDDRTRPLLSDAWAENLCQCWSNNPPNANVIDATRRLYEAGVDVLAATDAVTVGVPGTVHGVSMHGELNCWRRRRNPAAARCGRQLCCPPGVSA